MACELGGSHSHVDMASLYGKSIRQDILVGLFGGSIWRVKWAHLFKDLRARNIVEQKEIERNEMYYGGSVNCDIIM